CSRNISKYAKINRQTIQLYKLKDRDVLFNRTNSLKFVGRTGLFKKFSDEDIVFASYLVRIKPNSKTVTPEYLTTFLNTKYGITDIKRRARISINQSNVNPEELKKVEIPLVSNTLQKKITFLFDTAFKLIQKAETKYTEAESILLSELNLSNWESKKQLSFIKNYSDTQKASRIDAEYFQPKYEEIINKIKSYKGGWDKLENIISLKDNNFQPKEEQYYKYIELSHISNNGEITDCITEKGKKLPSRARRIVSEGDIIISSVEGSLSKIALIDRDYHRALCSTGFYVINSNILNSETVLLVMKSLIGKLQLKKGCSGMILSAINKDELLKIVCPIIKKNTQNKI
ncbi:MAG: restriction endonuclease subunit S, partial [Oligoflexia bacterium]|nr:restriction endonuclease subunit S [Oligoflexia bacterium]